MEEFLRTLSTLVLASLALLGPAAAQAAPYGIATDNGMTWEQVRFYGPAGGANSDYAAGQPIYYGTVPVDRCAGTDICGEAMTFDTKFGGLLTATAPDVFSGYQSIVYQDLSPNYGGLGVVKYKTPTRNDPDGLSGADEINNGEKLTLTFANTVKVVGFHFFDKDHRQSDLSSSDKFFLSVNGAANQALSFGGGYPWYGAGSTLIGNTFTFTYKNEDFYLGAIKIQAVTPPIPEPETYALMLGGLLAMGFMARRRARD
jgi:hypothetical protein